jgi:cell division protein FtsW
MRAPDRFGSLVAAGATAWITGQALINMGAVTGRLPITGVPLPFVSFGGSSLVVTMLAVGILVNVARATQEPGGGGRRRRPVPGGGR